MAAPPVDRRTAGLPPTGRRADGAARPERARAKGQLAQRAMFYAHLWLGVLFTVVLLGLSVTGILLNHKRGLGLMPQVENPAPQALGASLPLADLAERARTAAGLDEGAAPIDRMDVRPGDGYVKVRFDDPAWTEVTVDLATGTALHVGERGDVFMEQLHSGELFGKQWVYLTDAAAVALTVLLISGYWLWLAPRWRRR
jgi:uncharacterized iron-regulated membrane protein